MIVMKKAFAVSLVFALILFNVNNSFGQCTGTLITSFTLTSKTDITCFNGNDGQIVVTLNGGKAPFTYSLFIETGGGDIPIASIPNTNSQTATFSNLYASAVEGGTYKVTVVTTNGTSGSPSLAACQRRTIQNIDLDQPAELVASVSSITSACVANTGAIRLNVSGGTPFAGPVKYVYNWTGPTAIANTVEDPSSLAAGTYSVVIRDKNYNAGNPGFCEVTINDIIVPGQPTISLGPNPMVCTGVASSSISYFATTDSPDQYRIDWVSGITDVALTPLPSTPISITGIPVGPGTYTGALFVRNSTTLCESVGYPISVTVNALPVVSTPSATLCIGSTMTASPSTGGTWVSSNTSIATITNAGVITGVAAGSVTFTFTNGTTGCSNTTSSVTVNALPVVSTPSAALCIGSTMTASPVAGGTWISNAPGVAIITNAGLITGVTAGSVTFTFTSTATGCSNTTPAVTVNALPVVSTPSATLCIGSTMTASPSAGGTWVSSAPGVATITNAGLITGVSAGSVTFTFTDTATGCSNTTPAVTVNALPVVSTPSATLCVGSAMTASPVVGGTWVSSAPGVATITNAGLITGLSAGSVTFTFTSTATGCSNTTPAVTVNALPVVSTPSAILCIGATMTASPVAGGTWISSAPVVATITNAGLITGVTAGSVTFTFTSTATGCSSTTSSVTVNALPVVSTPSATLCIGSTMTASPSTGGTWVSSDPGIATIDNAGLVTGISAGAVSFTYIETTTGCSSTTSTVTINELPTAAISGATTICAGSTATLQIDFTGTSPWTFQYSDGVITTPGNSAIASISFTVSPVVNTTYTLVAVADSNCAGTISGSSVVVTVENVPLSGLAISPALSPVCEGGSSSIDITGSEAGVSYQLRNDADDSLIGSAIVGTSGNISIPTGVLATTTIFNVLATRGVCAPVELTAKATVTVLVGSIDVTLGVTAQASPVCEGTGTNIQIANSEAGVDYQLRDDADDSLIGVIVAGTGGSIDIPTGNLSSTKVFNILASNGVCSIELTNLATVNVDVNPDPSLALLAVINPLCIGGATTISIANSETGVSYQLRDDSDNSLVGSAISGTGATIDLPTGVLSSSKVFNVLATGGVCTPVQLTSTVSITVSGSINLSLPVTPASSTVCSGFSTDFQIASSEVGVDYRLVDVFDNSFLSAATAGTGGTISISTGPLTTPKDIKVFVTNGSCSAELTTTVTVLMSPSPVTTLAVNAVSGTLCSGESTMVQVVNSEVGVIYQLRDDADDSSVSGAVFGNGSTINLPTGILTSDKTFNVLATLGLCPVELINTVSVTVNAAPDRNITIMAQDPSVCIGKSTFVQVVNSEVGIIYQLRDNADNSNVSGATFGNGGTINLPTGPVNADRTFNVLASNTLCSVPLSSTVTVTVLAINDPLCSNCSTVIVGTKNATKVTCNASPPDGSIEFDIEPPVPVVNIIGVRIQISGPTSKTQTNNFVFTGLAAGNYNYVVTYGDVNNPDCLKSGSFVIELSREPDPITFDLTVNDYNCLLKEGSIVLENITGATGTDFEYAILSNGNSIFQGVIPNASTSSFKISDLVLGDYEVVLSQNQLPVNGCVGIVNSQPADLAIEEPVGGCSIIIPNVFTPNNDGANDFFEILYLPASSSLSITNRWGKEVFSSSDYQNNWSAEDISDGIYYYRLVAEGEVMTGWVEILR